ncbi:MAG: calcium/sodium antiporter [Rikenellaceae bacterium]
MITHLLLLTLGLTMIILGANFLTDGASLIARKFKVSEFIIGLTIVAIGTSAPELVVSITSALQGSTEMAVGNVVGSNIFNTLVILGIVAIIRPIRLNRQNSFETIPTTIITSSLLLVFSLSLFGVDFMPKTITRFEGIILLLGYGYFMFKSVFQKSGEKTISAHSEAQEVITNKKMAISVVMVLAGLAGLIFGGDMFLENAAIAAEMMGISKYVISVTLMAGGTSMPELVSCVVAARKGKSQMALGNVLGSNIANILLVLGAASTISPLSLSGSSFIDISLVVLGSFTLLVSIYTFGKHKIDRIEGVVMIAIYLGYLFYLLG